LWKSILGKKENTPKSAKKLLKNKRILISKCQVKEAQILHLDGQARLLVPAPRQLHHCFFMLDVAHSQADVETEFGMVSLILIFL